MKRRSFRRFIAVAACCLVSIGGGAHAQPFPTRPIHLIVPFGAGTSVDALARAIGNRLSAELRQPVVIENKVGASGIIGAQFVASAPPDGYTLMVGTSTVYSINPVILKLPYDPDKSFTPITMVGSQPLVVVTHPSVPASTMPQLIALGASGKGLTAGSLGSGTLSALTTALFATTTKTKILDVPYKTGAMTALIAGEINMRIDVIGVAMPLIKAGNLKALAVTTEKRSPLLPDVPSLSETCCPGFDVSTWNAIVGPAGMPPAIVQRLNTAFSNVLNSASFSEPFEKQGIRIASSTPELVSETIKKETARWSKVAADIGIKRE